MDSRDRFYGFSLLFKIFAEKKTYYAGIMLDAPSIVLCSKLCRHNVSDPTLAYSGLALHLGSYFDQNGCPKNWENCFKILDSLLAVNDTKVTTKSEM